MVLQGCSLLVPDQHQEPPSYHLWSIINYPLNITVCFTSKCHEIWHTAALKNSAGAWRYRLVGRVEPHQQSKVKGLSRSVLRFVSWRLISDGMEKETAGDASLSPESHPLPDVDTVSAPVHPDWTGPVQDLAVSPFLHWLFVTDSSRGAVGNRSRTRAADSEDILHRPPLVVWLAVWWCLLTRGPRTPSSRQTVMKWPICNSGLNYRSQLVHVGCLVVGCDLNMCHCCRSLCSFIQRCSCKEMGGGLVFGPPLQVSVIIRLP